MQGLFVTYLKVTINGFSDIKDLQFDLLRKVAFFFLISFYSSHSLTAVPFNVIAFNYPDLS